MASSNLPLGSIPPHSPFTDQLNAEGTACASDCPACAWAKNIASVELALLREICGHVAAIRAVMDRNMEAR